MRGTPFTKSYPGEQQKIWDRFDCLPLEFRTMVADDPNGHSLATLEAAEELAREAGLLPPLSEEKAPSKKERRSQKDRKRTEVAKARSRIIYRPPPGAVFLKKPLPNSRKVMIEVAPEKEEKRLHSEHNGKST